MAHGATRGDLRGLLARFGAVADASFAGGSIRAGFAIPAIARVPK
jgi:hypothetical protein